MTIQPVLYCEKHGDFSRNSACGACFDALEQQLEEVKREAEQLAADFIEEQRKTAQMADRLEHLSWHPIHTTPSDQVVDLFTDWAGVRHFNCRHDGQCWLEWSDQGNGPEWVEVPNPTHWKAVDKPASPDPS